MEMRLKRTVCILILDALIVVPAVSAGGCAERQQDGGNEAFREYTENLFCDAVAASTISLHYTLKEPEKFGITEEKAVWGEAGQDPEAVRASAENMQRALETFDYDSLNMQNRITYDILEYEVASSSEAADYILYEEPLSLVSGAQTQYPVVLSEYPFYDRQDADIYLQLLETTGTILTVCWFLSAGRLRKDCLCRIRRSTLCWSSAAVSWIWVTATICIPHLQTGSGNWLICLKKKKANTYRIMRWPWRTTYSRRTKN